MRILAITARADLGGGPEHLFQLTRAYGSAAQVTIACPDDAPYWDRFQTLDNVSDVVRIPHRAFRLLPLWRLRRVMKVNAIGLIHSHGKGAGIYGRLLSAMTGTPCLHTFHGLHLGEYGAAKRRAYLSIERGFGRFTRAAICVSPGEYDLIRAARLIAQDRLHVIPNGVDIPPGLPDANPEGPIRIAAVSRFDHQKNPMLLVDIALALRERIGTGFHLTIIGHGDLFGQVADRVAATGLGAQITLAGATPTPRKVLSQNQIFLSSSRWEGMPLAVLEAMSEGVVPVVTNVVGNRDVVTDGTTGQLFPAGDPAAGAEAVLAAHTDLTRLRAAAYQEVVTRFSVTRMARQTLDLSRSITD